MAPRPRRARMTAAQATAITLGIRAIVLGNDRYRRTLGAELGLGDSEIHALAHLYRAGPLTPTDLAERLGYGTGSTTAVLDRVQDAGYIERIPHPHDRRRLLVTLTDRGQQTMDWINDETAKRINDALSDHPDVDAAQLARHMTLIGDALRKAEVPPHE